MHPEKHTGGRRRRGEGRIGLIPPSVQLVEVGTAWITDACAESEEV